MNKQARRRTDDDDFETIIGHDGKPARVLRDGRSVRVRFRDAQAARGQPYAANDGRQALSDAERQALQGCRPGYRMIDNEQMRERRQRAADAYAEVEHRLSTAWKDQGNGRRFGTQGVEGDACTINGAPGHLRRIAGQLRCIADDEDDDSAFDDAQISDAREIAYRDYARELTRAWRRG
jgi:hypothetical protein